VITSSRTCAATSPGIPAATSTRWLHGGRPGAVHPVDEEVRRFRPSAGSRRFSVTDEFFRSCVRLTSGRALICREVGVGCCSWVVARRGRTPGRVHPSEAAGEWSGADAAHSS
jgi:hypothetical protein